MSFPQKTRTTVWKPPLTDPWTIGAKIITSHNVIVSNYCQVGMNGDTFSIKAPKQCSKKLLPFLKGNSLPEEMFLEHSFCS